MDKAIYQKTNDNKTWKMADFAFMQRNRNPYYKLPTGRNSNYSDQLYVTLQSLYENKGFDAAQWKKALYTAFGGKENIYQTSRKLRDEVLTGIYCIISCYFRGQLVFMMNSTKLIDKDSSKWTMASRGDDRFLSKI